MPVIVLLKLHIRALHLADLITELNGMSLCKGLRIARLRLIMHQASAASCPSSHHCATVSESLITMDTSTLRLPSCLLVFSSTLWTERLRDGEVKQVLWGKSWTRWQTW